MNDQPRGNVLFVDDNLDNLSILSNILGSIEYDIRVTDSGTQALELVKERLPDLILLDVMMPGMDGYEVCQRLKANPATADVPIIFISAVSATKNKINAFSVGGVDYITKPFRADEVLARVRTHLSLRELQKRLQSANQQLTEQVAELRARNEELDTFSHTVAHDLVAPLSAITGYADLLADDHAILPHDEIVKYARLIVQGGYKMGDVIKELLLLDSIRKAGDVELQTLNTAGIVASVQARFADLIKSQQAEIVVPKRWPTAIGHPTWVEEVWANYISNAITYGGHPPRVELGADEPENDDFSPSSRMIHFWVRDNGQGLPPGEPAQLFTHDRPAHAKGLGMGLGLAIVRRILNRLGGQSWVKSEPGKGATFYFSLPRKP